MSSPRRGKLLEGWRPTHWAWATNSATTAKQRTLRPLRGRPAHAMTAKGDRLVIVVNVRNERLGKLKS